MGSSGKNSVYVALPLGVRGGGFTDFVRALGFYYWAFSPVWCEGAEDPLSSGPIIGKCGGAADPLSSWSLVGKSKEGCGPPE